jgi:hypothetical protein
MEAIMAEWGPMLYTGTGIMLLLTMMFGGQFILMMLNQYFLDRGNSVGSVHLKSLAITLGFYWMLPGLAQPVFIILGTLHLATFTTAFTGHKSEFPDWVKKLYRLDRNGNPIQRR